MRGRSWFRDFFHHFVLILLFAAGLFFVWRRVVSTPELHEITWLRWLLYASAVVLFILFVVFVNSILSSNYLERFDPGKPGSLKRLDRIKRFKLKAAWSARLKEWSEPILQVSHLLQLDGFEEKARWTFGIVYERPRPKPIFGRRQRVDRFFLYYKPMLNVLIVDHVLKECMNYIDRHAGRRHAPRNMILFVTDMTDRDEVTSSAAGVVNFLGKIPGGSLGPMLLDLGFGRLFYPLDRSMIKFSDRKFQDRLRKNMLRQILSDRVLKRGERFERAADNAGIRKARLTVAIPQQQIDEALSGEPCPVAPLDEARQPDIDPAKGASQKKDAAHGKRTKGARPRQKQLPKTEENVQSDALN